MTFQKCKIRVLKQYKYKFSQRFNDYIKKNNLMQVENFKLLNIFYKKYSRFYTVKRVGVIVKSQNCYINTVNTFIYREKSVEMKVLKQYFQVE